MKAILSLLVIIACKPAIRQQTSDLQAITDGKLMLGTVAAVTKQGNHQVYRLLVCKNSVNTEDKSVFSDTNSCRPALVSKETNKEIVLFPNHLHRGFAEKWKGRLKRATIGTIIALPFMVAIPIAQVVGKPVYKYVKNTVKKGDIDVAPKLVDSAPGLAGKGSKFYQQQLNLQSEEIIKFINNIKGKELTQQELTAVVEIIELHGNTLSSINQTGLINQLEDYRQMLLDLKRTGQQLASSPMTKQEDEFLDDFALKYIEHENKFFNFEKVRKGIYKIPSQNEMIEALQRLTATSKQLTDDMPSYHTLFVSKNLVDSDKTIDEAISIIDRKLTATRQKYDKFAKERDDFAEGMRIQGRQEILEKLFEFSWFAWGVGLAAGTSAIVALEESIWGHGDRQASRYWNKIFHDGYYLDRAMTVKDLPKILHSLAKTFRCQVNDRALQLETYNLL